MSRAGMIAYRAMAASASGFRPSDLANMVLDLDADAGAFTTSGGATPAAADADPVGQLNDQSGNGIHFTQSTTTKRPLLKLGVTGYNGHRVLRFDGTDDYLVSAVHDLSAAPHAATVYAVFGVSTADDAMIYEYGNNNVDGFYLYHHTDGNVWAGLLGNAGSNAFAHYAVVNGPVRAAGTYDKNLNQRETDAYVNGARFGSMIAGSNNNNTTLPFGSTRTSFVGSRGGTTQFGAMDLARVIVFKGRHQGTTRHKMQRYLAERYGAGWPYVNQLVFIGDSMTRGYNETPANNYPSQLVAGLSSASTALMTNYGHDGQPAVTINNEAAARWTGEFSTEMAKNVAFVWAGTNDLTLGTSAASTYNAIAAACTTLKAAGFTVIVGTLLPRGDGAAPVDFETKRTTINTSIRTNYATIATGLFDPAADPRIGDAGDNADGTYYNADQLHMVAAGYGVVADLARAALATYAGIT